MEKQDGVECELREGEEFSSTKQKPENVGREKFGAKWCEKVRGGGGASTEVGRWSEKNRN